MPGTTTSIRNVREFCVSILSLGDLESKLRRPRSQSGDLLPDDDRHPALLVSSPNRDPELTMGSGTERLPRLNQLRDPRARIECLERFANHELMAIELFAWALLAFPDLPAGLRRGFLRVLEEEQIHLGLYLERLRDLRAPSSPTAISTAGSGSQDEDDAPFTTLPLGNYFWQQVPVLSASPYGPRAFLAAMGLTFEQANLDYSLLYRDAFRDAGDEETARVIERVHRDEIGHVRLAATWIRRLATEARHEDVDRDGASPVKADLDTIEIDAVDLDAVESGVVETAVGNDAEKRRVDRFDGSRSSSFRSDVELYVEAVPFPLSAARAKGRRFDAESRRRAGLSEEMIAFVRDAVPYDRNEGTPARGDHELFANLGAEEELEPRPDAISERESLPHREYSGKPARAWSSTAARNAAALSAIWLLATGLPETSRVFLPGAPRRRSGSSADRLHPAVREWMASQSQLSSIMTVLSEGARLTSTSQCGGLIPWLSTDAALQRAQQEGLQYLGPDPDVVSRVHDKAFAVRVGAASWSDSVARFVALLSPSELRDEARAAEWIASLVATWPAQLRKSLTLKPWFGTSGRGRVFGVEGKLPPASIRGLARLADRGGAVLEPWFDRTGDFSVQLLVRRSGEIELLGSTEQIVARSGLYLGNRGILHAELSAGERRAKAFECPSVDREFECSSGHPEDARLEDAAIAIAQAAADQRFFGPCGVDSFSYRSLDESEQIRPVVEFNARITTGTLALAAVRAVLEITGETSATRWEFRLSGTRDQNRQSSVDDPSPSCWRVTFPLLVDGESGPIVRLG